MSTSSIDGSITWKVVNEVVEDDMSDIIEEEIQHLKSHHTIKDNSVMDCLTNLFCYMYPGDIEDDVDQLNNIIKHKNELRKKLFKSTIKKVSSMLYYFLL